MKNFYFEIFFRIRILNQRIKRKDKLHGGEEREGKKRINKREIERDIKFKYLKKKLNKYSPRNK